MKRILLAIAMIVLAGTTAFATTRATWTDTVTVSANQVVTGNADLQVATSGPWVTDTAVSNFSVSGLVPSSTPTDGGFSFWLKNVSTSPIIFSLGGKITDNLVSPGSPAPDETKLWIQIYNIDNPSEATPWQTFADWKVAPTGGINFNSTLGNGVQKQYGIKVQLDPTADNYWQGQTVTFTVEVLGTQI